jgi:hypothetical protein
MPTDAYDVYCLYIAIKLHFESDYDAIKFKFQAKVRPESFQAHRSRFMFQKLGRKYSKKEIINLFVANHVYRTASWIGDVDDELLTRYTANSEKLEYNFRCDMDEVFTDIHTGKQFRSLFKCKDGQHAPIFAMLLANKIKIESFIALNDVYPFFDQMAIDLDFKSIWQMYERLCNKYRRFMTFDKEMIRKYLRSQVENLAKDSNYFPEKTK